MDYGFMEPFTVPKASGVVTTTLQSGCPVDHDTFDLETTSSFYNKRASRILVNQIHLMTSPVCRPSYVLAEIALLMRNSYVVNQLLSKRIAPVPSASKCSAPNKVICSGNVAELLTVDKMRSKLGSTKGFKATKNSLPVVSGLSAVRSTAQKENELRSGQTKMGGKKSGSSDSILDDVPIAQWPTRAKKSIGRRTVLAAVDCNRTAAEALVTLAERQRDRNPE
ncbi:hypothetical protein BWQ96_04666 [Gracilariopsis chorda]|uniref:Uncharacterized protein n=1 Tax=Gracilariopsis chorda TaxID=448386 RepID=A0A2V3IU13_9FLOR|nr:hypothetical protein BWQ96_04666 [Gracilariopsis chorda]|eukprot:PXF45589.1 hypothetical protein BWQ96_04666 [Gracilariopsis chorda]